MTDPHWRTRFPGPQDRDRLGELYRGYADFYQTTPPEGSTDLVWSWIHDPASPVGCLLVVDEDDRPFGLAHYRPFPRPLSATTGCWLDDLFVDPAARGGGAADLLLGDLRALAVANGWSVVRWITADDNHRARAKYDKYATRTWWITYDMEP